MVDIALNSLLRLILQNIFSVQYFFHHFAKGFGLIDLAAAGAREKCEGQHSEVFRPETDEGQSKRSFDVGL